MAQHRQFPSFILFIQFSFLLFFLGGLCWVFIAVQALLQLWRMGVALQFVVHGLLIAAASLGHLGSVVTSPRLLSTGSIVLWHTTLVALRHTLSHQRSPSPTLDIYQDGGQLRMALILTLKALGCFQSVNYIICFLLQQEINFQCFSFKDLLSLGYVSTATLLVIFLTATLS